MTTGHALAEPEHVLTGEEMLHLQDVVRKVPVSDLIVDYVATVIRSTPGSGGGDPPQFVKDWVLWGVGPRGGQSLIAAAQAPRRASTGARRWRSKTRAMATPVPRHRLVLNYNAESQGQRPRR